MSSAGRPILSGHIKRRNWARLIRDILLLPPALLYVIIERVFWAGAQTLLRHAARIRAVAAAQEKLGQLPVAVVLPLFLVPEIFSHIGGFWASVLLVKQQWVAAILVGIFIKGLATLMVVWIYQGSAPTLLSVRWFAWVHAQALRGRDWVAQRIKPAADFALRLVRGNGSTIARRFTAMRKVLVARLGLHQK